MKKLSKSKFRTGIDCPNKLYFLSKGNLYYNKKIDDPFLESLAQGGFQVEELARLHYPDGRFIEAHPGDYEASVAETHPLIESHENIAIYEAAFEYDGCYVRSDVVVKKGEHIKLIEVKAKSYDPNNDYEFIGKRGALTSQWKPYLFDLAYQYYVASNAYPNLKITSYLMLADKSKEAQVEGLNQLFRIPSKEEGNQRFDIERKVHSLEDVGDSVLSEKNVQPIIDDIISGKYKYHKNLSFKEAIDLLKQVYFKEEYPNWPTNFSACKKCEFRADQSDVPEGQERGYLKCFKTQHQWTDSCCTKPSAFEVWNFQGKNLIEENRLFIEDLEEQDFKVEPKAGQISSSERRWIQVEKRKNGDNSIYCLNEELRDEIKQWKYPLHFIDFETSSVALPFFKGGRPYEQVAFQFSHHKVLENGTITHQNEFIDAEPGHFPNFEFARSLKRALEEDNGSIFMFATHENSVLNAIINQLRLSKESDKDQLMSFLKSITKSTANNTESWKGDRVMIDFRDIVLKYYYNPLTKGSNSIKDLLPAVLESDNHLQTRYAKSIGELGISSLNFDSKHIWITKEKGKVDNPYKMLPPLFENWNSNEKDILISGISDIANGGEAMTAYAKLQYVDMTGKEREELVFGLKKYCELDTLAMVMIWEHLKGLVK
jgi:hypothetical protein